MVFLWNDPDLSNFNTRFFFFNADLYLQSLKHSCKNRNSEQIIQRQCEIFLINNF
jgi:hypothetical protein